MNEYVPLEKQPRKEQSSIEADIVSLSDSIDNLIRRADRLQRNNDGYSFHGEVNNRQTHTGVIHETIRRVVMAVANRKQDYFGIKDGEGRISLKKVAALWLAVEYHDVGNFFHVENNSIRMRAQQVFADAEDESISILKFHISSKKEKLQQMIQKGLSRVCSSKKVLLPQHQENWFTEEEWKEIFGEAESLIDSTNMKKNKGPALKPQSSDGLSLRDLMAIADQTASIFYKDQTDFRFHPSITLLSEYQRGHIPPPKISLESFLNFSKTVADGEVGKKLIELLGAQSDLDRALRSNEELRQYL
ncbi:MAG: hypothetical protein N3A54_04370, partial [Patescibacteria group bacterium]|nr:hypothetical protein [Patescibacteria group bacterium]